MDRKVVLAGSLREANAYCREKGIRAVFASTPSQIKQATHLIELPGFSQRRDRFALEQARDSRKRFGREVRYDLESDWVMPKPQATEGEVTEELENGFAETTGVHQLDLTDEATLEELKAALNEVGLTLKKLPKKGDSEAPVVPAPVEF